MHGLCMILIESYGPLGDIYPKNAANDLIGMAGSVWGSRTSCMPGTGQGYALYIKVAIFSAETSYRQELTYFGA